MNKPEHGEMVIEAQKRIAAEEALLHYGTVDGSLRGECTVLIAG